MVGNRLALNTVGRPCHEEPQERPSELHSRAAGSIPSSGGIPDRVSMPIIRKPTNPRDAPLAEHSAILSGRGLASQTPDVYDLCVAEVAVSEARNRLDEVIEESQRSGEPISVTRRGRRVAVIVDSAAFDRLVGLAEDAEDRRAIEAVRADDDYVTWDEAKAALRLE